MRAYQHSRQARRAGRCIRACSLRYYELPTTASAAAGHELAQVAARIAEELDLSPDAIDDLLWGPTPPGGDVRGR